jgi:hypothetical protein
MTLQEFCDKYNVFKLANFGPDITFRAVCVLEKVHNASEFYTTKNPELLQKHIVGEMVCEVASKMEQMKKDFDEITS